ncbi:MAG: hypothetical protein R3E82_17720 [Pseudomonadales bacterium]|nr:hypothetical protein [Pseudomonadales bacterium]
MKAVLQLFWRICLLRQSPEVVPTQNWFVATVIALNLLGSMIVSSFLDSTTDSLTTLTRIVVGQATNAGLVWLALQFREHPQRLVATLTALFGCDLIITACFGLLVPLLPLFGESGMNFLSLGFFVWSVAVAGFIMSRALAVPVVAGSVIAMGMMVFSVAMSQIATQGAA